MAVLVTQVFEGTLDQYDSANSKVDAAGNPPDGLIVHTAADAGGGKVRVLDVWESPGQFEAFAQERVGPAVAEVLGEEAPPPEIEITELHNVLAP